MAIIATYFQTDREARGIVLPADELYRRCEDAARIALRGDEATTRADCAADIFGDALTLCAADRGPRYPAVHPINPMGHRREGAVKVLDYIAATERRIAAGTVTLSSDDRAESFLPLRTDDRFSFTALKRDATNWRKRNDIRRSTDDLKSGKGAKRAAEDTPLSDAYLRRAAEQDAAASRRCAVLACRGLGIAPGSDSEPSDAAIVFYAHARRAADGMICAELGIAADAFRKRLSRGAKDIRQGRDAATLLLALMDSAQPFQIPRKTSRDLFTTVQGKARTSARNPSRIAAGTVLIALADESRDAESRSAFLTIGSGTVAGRRATVGIGADGHTLVSWQAMPATGRGWREGTANGEAPERPNDARQAREACRIRTLPADQHREAARVSEEETSQSLRRLGGALGGMRGRMPKNAVGQTRGKPAEKYASRAVRLGKNAG